MVEVGHRYESHSRPSDSYLRPTSTIGAAARLASNA